MVSVTHNNWHVKTQKDGLPVTKKAMVYSFLIVNLFDGFMYM